MALSLNSSRKIIKAASACVWRGDAVLLVQRAKTLGYGRWSLPGGRIEGDEVALAAALRELREETGVAADLRWHVGDFDIATENVTYVISCFTGFYGAGLTCAGDDAMAVAWVNYENLSTYDLALRTHEAISIARNLTSV